MIPDQNFCVLSALDFNHCSRYKITVLMTRWDQVENQVLVGKRNLKYVCDVCPKLNATKYKYIHMKSAW